MHDDEFLQNKHFKKGFAACKGLEASRGPSLDLTWQTGVPFNPTIDLSGANAKAKPSLSQGPLRPNGL